MIPNQSTNSSSNAADPPSTGGADAGLSRAESGGAPLSAVILAAGQGTRMRSGRHKVLHPLAGKPLILRVLDLARHAGADDCVVVLGYLADQVRAALPADVRTAIQEPQLGTGHAVQVAAEHLRRPEQGDHRVLVLLGDNALVRPESLRRLLAQPVGPQAPLALLTARVREPRGYGRVLRATDGTVAAMVEEAEASDEQRQVNEIWSGVMLLWAPWAWQRLPRLPRRSKGEYYLTDLVNLATTEHLAVLAALADDEDEVLGVNDRAQLARANQVLWERKRQELMQSGVTLLDPASTFVEPQVEVAADALIHPGCHLLGTTRVGAGCEIGPGSYLHDSVVGEDSRVWLSVLEGAQVGRHVSIGPFSHLRPGAIVEDDVELGNYAEVKGSRIGAGTRMHHFGYVGDAQIGERVNIGAGTVTCNYDGRQKHRTVIGDGAFIGSDSMLVAPVEVGAGAATGAGAVVTRDVAPGEVVAGVPARPLRRPAHKGSGAPRGEEPA